MYGSQQTRDHWEDPAYLSVWVPQCAWLTLCPASLKMTYLRAFLWVCNSASEVWCIINLPSWHRAETLMSGPSLHFLDWTIFTFKTIHLILVYKIKRLTEALLMKFYISLKLSLGKVHAFFFKFLWSSRNLNHSYFTQ